MTRYRPPHDLARLCQRHKGKGRTAEADLEGQPPIRFQHFQNKERLTGPSAGGRVRGSGAEA